MKTILSILNIALITQIGFCQLEYFNTIEKNSWDYGAAIIEKENGNLLIASSSRSQSNSSYDILLMTIDTSNGQIVNEKYLGDSDTLEFVNSIQKTLDGGYILGGTNRIGGFSNPYLMKINSNDEKEWDIKLPSFDFFLEGFYAIQHSNQNYFMLGKVDYQIPKTFFYKVGVNGNLELADTLSNIYGNQIIESHDNKLMLIGSIPIGDYDSDIVLSKLNIDGDTIWTRQYDEGVSFGSSIAKTNDGGYLLACYYEPVIADAYSQTILLKVDSVGNIDWKTELNSGIPSFIENTGNGFVLSSVYLANFIFGFPEPYMIARKLNDEGIVVCSKTYEGDIYNQNGTNILESSGGNVFMIGHFNEPADIFISKISSDCNVITDLDEKVIDFKIKISPNPTSEICTIENIPRNSFIKIYNQIGELIFQGRSTNDFLKIDTQNLPNGIYVVNVKTNLISKSAKLIISK